MYQVLSGSKMQIMLKRAGKVHYGVLFPYACDPIQLMWHKVIIFACNYLQFKDQPESFELKPLCRITLMHSHQFCLLEFFYGNWAGKLHSRPFSISINTTEFFLKLF